MPEGKYVCISYVPLLVGESGHLLSEEELQKADLDKHEMLTQCDALIWMLDEATNTSNPVIVHSHAGPIVDHIRYWSENKPAEWFEFHLYEHLGQLVCLLFPKAEKTIERFKLAMGLQTMTPVNQIEDEKISVMTMPLIWYSHPGTMGQAYLDSKSTIRDTVKIEFLETAVVQGQHEISTDLETTIQKNTIKLDEFEVHRNSDKIGPFVEDFVRRVYGK